MIRRMDVPGSLRRWFVAHFAVDLLFGVPLLLFPGTLLGWLAFGCVDPASPRLVGAALLAIGGRSLLGKAAGVEAFRVMLDLKIVWSLAAIVGLVVAVGQGAPPATWAFLAIFIVFAGVWIHYRVRFKQLAAASD
jgi:hypothetical protein